MEAMMAKSNTSDWDNDNGEVLREAYSQMKRWGQATIILGVALVVSVTMVIPFLDGHPLHEHFGTIGKYLIYLSMGLLPALVGCAALTYNFWSYWRRISSKR
jgi:hypothetical protein